jgi:transposase
MNKCSTEQKKVYVGFDVSEKAIEVYAVCGDVSSQGRTKINNDKRSIKEFLSMFKKPSQVCVVMETGTHSPWMSRFIDELGFEVIVAHARDLALIYGSDKKNDQLDAEKLARLAQADRKLLHPVKHMTAERQVDLAVLKARQLVERQRTQIINSIRGLLRTTGHKLIEQDYSSCTIKKCYEALPEDMKPVLAPLIQQLYYLELAIKDYDKQITKLCKKYKVTKILQKIRGVGPIIALSFVLIVGDPDRFPDAARLCAYFGLVPKQDQSGNVDKQLGITKNGNNMMRRVLVQGAQYMMGHWGEDSDLRDYGLRIQARGGTIAKKKSYVAVARKLVAVMLALWKNPDIPYDPKYKKNKASKIA